MEAVWLDLRSAWRWLRNSPGFAVAAIGTLALGIGVTTSMLSVMNGVLLRPLPIPEADRTLFLTRGGDVSIPDLVDWRASSRTMESMAAFARNWAFDLTGAGEPERINGYPVEPEYFDVVKIKPLLGRVFTKEENHPGGTHLLLLVEGYWRRRFGGDPAVVGRTVTVSGNPATIIGVLPQSFDFLHDEMQIVVPMAVELPWALAERGANNLDAIGRMRPGTTVEQASAELRGIETRIAEQYPRTNTGKVFSPLPMTEFIIGSVRPAVLILSAAVAMVLLIASINLAGLLLARATARRQEFAVRVALGAGRSGVVRQMLVEGILLAVLGGMAGLGAAAAGQRLIRLAVPAELPRLGEIAVDWRVAMLSLAAITIAGLLCGMIPAWQVARADPALALQGHGKGAVTAGGRHRLLRAVVIAEVACAAALLVGSGLLLKSLATLWAQPLGFEPHQVLAADLVLPDSRYASRAGQTRAFATIVDRLRELPGVTGAAYIVSMPLTGAYGIGNKVLFEGRADIPEDRPSGARGRLVYGDYFHTLTIPIVRGRAFTSQDREGSLPVAIVNESMVRQFWPGRDPIGQRIAWRDWHDPDTGPLWMTIVGVARNVKGQNLAEEDSPAIYTPYVQRQVDWQRFGDLVIRTAADPAVFAASLKKTVWSFDPLLAVGPVTSLETVRFRSAARERFNASVLSGFGIVALLLVAQGLYGIVAYAVAERRREIGVRMALGATRRNVVTLVLRHGLAPAGIGLGVGLLAALGLTRFLESLLFGIRPTDPLVFAGIALLLPLVALGATFVPAYRAARTDPVDVIRTD